MLVIIFIVVYQRCPHCLRTVGISVVVTFKQIGKEEELENEKQYEQFDENHGPQVAPDSHGTEAVTIETVNPYDHISGPGTLILPHNTVFNKNTYSFLKKQIKSREIRVSSGFLYPFYTLSDTGHCGLPH